MSSKHSYTITLENNKSEKEAIKFLLDSDENFILPSKESRKELMEFLNIDKKFIRAFDLILIEGHTNQEAAIELNNKSSITLIELKTTKKKISNMPFGFFFGATENEFNLAQAFKDQFKFCFVSLHPESKSYKMLTLSELNKIIKTKRIQYQINL
jgi:CRISPR/Cas system-associated endonuclease/helicase Cas3